MGDMTRKKTEVLLFAAFASAILLALYGLYFCLQFIQYKPDENLIRVAANDAVSAVENGNLAILKNTDYVFADLNGTVLAENHSKYRQGEKIDLHTFSGLRNENISETGAETRFVSPVIKNGRQTGTLLVFINAANYRKSTGWIFLFPLILFFGLAVLLLLNLGRFIRKDIFMPVELLHTAIREILNGNYSAKLAYDYTGEVGTLCHDFEMMRGELQAGVSREKKMAENEKLLLACISHDLKTPLAAISGYVEEIHDGIIQNGTQIRSYTEIILKKVQVLSKLIDDILEHSKAELNEFSICKQEVYSQNYFYNLFSDLSLDAAKNGLSFHVGQIPNVLLNLDKKRISQVVQNIVSNSIKYTPTGGSINVSFETGPSEFIVIIRDTGCGISAEDIPFVFDKFYRGEKARTQNIPGSGLGLNIAKYIVEKHGGRIECDSVLNEGTAITFSVAIK